MPWCLKCAAGTMVLVARAVQKAGFWGVAQNPNTCCPIWASLSNFLLHRLCQIAWAARTSGVVTSVSSISEPSSLGMGHGGSTLVSFQQLSSVRLLYLLCYHQAHPIIMSFQLKPTKPDPLFLPFQLRSISILVSTGRKRKFEDCHLPKP